MGHARGPLRICIRDERIRVLDLEGAIELALGELRSGPTLSAFGIAREDCALAHIDYFHSIDMASNLLAQALADVRGVGIQAIHHEFSPQPAPCDCESCIGPEKAREAVKKHRAAYTNVKEWIEVCGTRTGTSTSEPSPQAAG